MKFPNENQKITMVTGKGGVGKSAIAAAIAQNYANQGLKTLLVELGDQSYFEHVYGKKITYQPTEISRNFSISLWGGAESLREYVRYLIRVEKLVDLFFNNKVMKTFINAAPALKELAILGKVTSGIRRWGPPLEYDRLVVDGYSTGHFLALLKAPIGMSELIEFGPMGEQSRNISQVLSQPHLCEYIVVSLAEELPVTETIELSEDLYRITGQRAKIFTNKIYECDVPSEALAAASAHPFTDFLNEYLKRQKEQLHNLSARLPIEKTMPLLFTPVGRDVIDRLEMAMQ
ncbi:MAG: arsenical pump-driving ATPase [Bdellovibrionales bacterium]|nr:arsenical pump-driving ATPase [Bdellovibrionales bacterium]